MSSIELNPAPPSPVGEPLSLKDLATLLVKHNNLHAGLYDLMIEYQIGGGPIGPTPDQRIPGVLVGVSKIALTVAKEVGHLTVDAAVVNPPTKKKKAEK